MSRRSRENFGAVKRLRLGRGKRLYLQGEPARQFFYIQTGRVQLSVVSDRGKEAIIALLHDGDFCGHGTVIGDSLHLSTATCLSDCVVAQLEKHQVTRAVHEDAQFTEVYLKYLLGRLTGLRENLVSHFFDTSEQRLARVLLMLTNYGKQGWSEPIIGKIDQETLGRMIGTTRARVNHFMNRFRDLGYIDYKGGLDIVVHSSILNVLLADHRSAKTKRPPSRT